MPRGIPRWLEAGTSSHFSYAATPPRISIQSTSTLTAVMDIYADEGIPRTYRIGNFRPVLRLDSPALQALVRANQRALRTLAEQPRLAVDYIASFLNRLTRDEAQRHYERYIGPYFTPNGQVDLDVARQAIDAVAAKLGVAPVAVEDIYSSTEKHSLT